MKTFLIQFEDSEIYHPKLKYCAETSVYGTTICTELEAKHIQKPKDYPLNYFLGYFEFVCQLEPGKLYYILLDSKMLILNLSIIKMEFMLIFSFIFQKLRLLNQLIRSKFRSTLFLINTHQV